MDKQLSRRPYMAEKIIFVDGLSGSGKSLVSMLISSLERVELLSFLYELESYCILYNLEKLSMDAAKTMVRIQTDLKLYNTMMGRDVNFRPTDLSSAVKSHNSAQYLQRLFEPGDEVIPDIIQYKKPILNLCVHNLLSYSQPIWEALGKRCVFVNVVRHPVYMVHQQSAQMEVPDIRDLAIHYDYNSQDIPYFVNNWEELYLKSNSLERAIYYSREMSRRNQKNGHDIKQKYSSQILTIPFELFVLNPESWIQDIAKKLGVSTTNVTRTIMSEQNIPRDKVSAGPVSDLYIRYGWTPPTGSASERDELNIRREDIASKIDKKALLVLDELSYEYEAKFWSPK